MGEAWRWLAPRGKRRPLKKALVAGLVASGLSARRSLLPRAPGDQFLVSTGAGLMGAAAGAASEVALAAAARRADGGRAAVVGASLAGAGVALAWARAAGRRGGVPAAVESASLTTLALAGAAEGGMQLYELVPPQQRVEAIKRAGGILLGAAGAALALKRKLDEPADLVKAGIPYRYLPSVSGGAGSLAPLETLDREGRKFLGLATPATAIAEVTGAPAQDPVRVYVGLGSAPTPQERAEVAVAELERLGAFTRSRILVICPAGPGFVNPVPVEATECMTGGDMASVAVQYSTRRAHRAKDDRPVARETLRLLLETLRDRIARCPPDRRPELAVYGESLGAWIGAELFHEGGGLRALADLAVDRAALIGVPYWGAQRLALVRDRLGELPESVGVFTTADELESFPPERLESLRYVVLIHPEDPVASFSGRRLLWERPSWLPLRGPRHGRIPREMWWMPGITWLQVLLDVKNATGSGRVFVPYGHDYRLELPAILRAAFGHLEQPTERLRAIEARTLRSWEEQLEREARAREAGRYSFRQAKTSVL